MKTVKPTTFKIKLKVLKTQLYPRKNTLLGLVLLAILLASVRNFYPVNVKSGSRTLKIGATRKISPSSMGISSSLKGRNSKMEQWWKLKHFTKDENWGNPYKMDDDHLIKLDQFRSEIDSPIIVTSGTGGMHSPNSAHYDGLATDIIILGCELDVLDLMFIALRHGFSGIGYYPEWKYDGKKVGGWHLDSATRKAMWLGVKEKGEQVYKKFTQKNLKKFEII